MSRNRHSNWTLTLHYGGDAQPTREHVQSSLHNLFDNHGKYIVIGYEVAPTTGQKHAQSYVQLVKPLRFSELQKLLGSAHIEPAVADEVKNREYCLKIVNGVQGNLDFEEFGTPVPVNPGKREQDRWAVARLAATEGRFEDVDDRIFVQCYSSIRAIARDHLVLPHDLDYLPGVWIYGPSGCGKSRSARVDYGTDPTQLYLKPLNKWWDGYRNQKNVLLEDFGKEHSVLGYHLKIWGDRYAFPAEIKGSTITLRPSFIVVTSQYHPREIWSDLETVEAISRRYRLVWKGPLPNPYDPLPLSRLVPLMPTMTIPSQSNLVNTKSTITLLPSLTEFIRTGANVPSVDQTEPSVGRLELQSGPQSDLLPIWNSTTLQTNSLLQPIVSDRSFRTCGIPGTPNPFLDSSDMC